VVRRVADRPREPALRYASRPTGPRVGRGFPDLGCGVAYDWMRAEVRGLFDRRSQGRRAVVTSCVAAIVVALPARPPAIRRIRRRRDKGQRRRKELVRVPATLPSRLQLGSRCSQRRRCARSLAFEHETVRSSRPPDRDPLARRHSGSRAGDGARCTEQRHTSCRRRPYSSRGRASCKPRLVVTVCNGWAGVPMHVASTNCATNLAPVKRRRKSPRRRCHTERCRWSGILRPFGRDKFSP
jgi:hypothetical protein